MSCTTFPRILALLLCCASLCAGTGENFNCTTSTCDSVSCCDDPTNTHCPPTTCTDGQLQVVSPKKPCQCCTRCIDLQAEGEECDIDNSDSFGDLPQQICGHGLTCTPRHNTGYCLKIVDTKCSRMQQEYDKEALTSLIPGKLRPACDGDGWFRPAQRLPGLTTSCYSETGDRIYGEVGSTDDAAMGCQCSRLYVSKAYVEGLPPRAQCTTDGNFDALQCNSVTCFCVDVNNGTVVSPVAAWKFKDLLPCYNETLHNKEYLKPCQKLKYELEEERKDWARQGFSIIGVANPSCDIGGYFDKVQESRTERTCVAPDGTPLEGYVVPRSSEAAESMTCNCARASYHMTAAGQLADLPQCCSNGDFRAWQCRGLYCYCVDAAGYQYGAAQPQSNLKQLPCIQVACPSHAPRL